MTEKGYLHPFHDGSLFEFGVGEEIRTIVELKMCRLSYYIRSTPRWWERLDEPAIIEVWKQVARSESFLQHESSLGDCVDLRTFPPMTERQIAWVLDELPSYARRIDHTSGCQLSCFERAWESDSAMPQELMRDIHEQIQRRYLSTEELRELSIRRTKPITEETPTILDFIHPFDFPIISNRTLRIEHHETGTHICKAFLNTYVSAIPTDFFVPSEPTAPVVRLGYINNLPPTKLFDPLASLIARAVGYFVPLFDQLLTSLHRANHALLEPRIPLQRHPLRYERGEDPPDEPGQGVGEGTDDEEDVDMLAAWGEAHRQWVLSRRVVLPDIPPHGSVDSEKFAILEENRVTLRGRKIQVAVQLSRLELTPEKPSFNGGQWKCQGSLEDHIVASGMIVLDQENVTEGSLDLRMAVTRPLLSYDDPNSACMAYWGMTRGSKLNQHIGSIKLRRGRCIAYPNIYQSQLSPINLIDPTVPGHRTVLQLYLIDPEIPVLSSTDIPPQQASWTMEALLDSLDKRLPVEIVQKIVDCAIDERWLLPDSDRWALRNFVEMTQKLNREMLKRYFEETL